MYLPDLSNIAQSTITIDSFKGVNKTETIQANEFSDMENMSSDQYPSLSPRNKRYFNAKFQWLINQPKSAKILISTFHLDTSKYISFFCRVKKSDGYMDADDINTTITGFINKHIKFNDVVYKIKKMDFTSTTLNEYIGVLVICFEKIYDVAALAQYFYSSSEITIYDDNGNTVNDAICQTTNDLTRMVYVNDSIFWLANGTINKASYTDELQAICVFADSRSRQYHLETDLGYYDFLIKLKQMYETLNSFVLTVDNVEYECDSIMKLNNKVRLSFPGSSLKIGQQYVVKLPETVGMSVSTITNECTDDTDLIVGGNKIISLPSMYTYDTKYGTEERMSDKAEFQLDNGNSNNIRIKRIVEDVSDDTQDVTWQFEINTTKTANFWKRTVENNIKGYSVETINEEKELIVFYKRNSSNEITETVSLKNSLVSTPNNIIFPTDITELGASKIIFEIPLGYIKYFELNSAVSSSSYDYFDYSLRKKFINSQSISEKVNTTERSISFDFLGYEPQYDTVIGYVPEGEMDELPFDLGYAVSAGNRIYACNTTGDRVYISVIGRIQDFVNEENGNMSADDIGVLSDGEFTAIANFNQNTYFFKEDCVHKLYGTYSADWQLVEIKVNGVQKGADKSIAVFDNFIIYKGVDAFYMFDGSQAVDISENLGPLLNIENLKCCFAAAFKNKYFACCESTDNGESRYTMFVYDISKGLWHIEENNSKTGYRSMCSSPRGIIAMEDNKNISEDTQLNKIVILAGKVFTSDENIEDDFDWSATTGDLLTDIPNNKYLTKLQLRLKVSDTATVKITVKYDDGEWEQIGNTITSTHKKIKVFPIIPRRCGHLALKISGRGNARIYSLTETIEEATEI